ncbi:MAG: pyruvate kinase [Planctomycetes bacterium]|nr:pyruvate kinase [Planctomycetota bacterium]
MFKRTKIVATVGPSSWNPSKLKALMLAGADVFRINFSHGERARHAETMATIRAVEENLGRPVAILADLQGPRVRLGRLPGPGIVLKRGDNIQLFAGSDYKTGGPIPVTHARFAGDVHPGARVLIADGEIEARVESIKNGVVGAQVVRGGILKSNKGINLPDCNISIATLTAKDRADLAFAAAAGVDAIAISFVGSAADVRLAKKLLIKAKSDAIVIAKIERATAVANIDGILEAADGVMIARGDLAVEVGYENVPVLQKEIIQKATALARPTIVATQMLDSMTDHPRPTRAEASDVANAIFDHADAVMLSGETAVGEFPVESVRVMTKIIHRVESYFCDRGFNHSEVAGSIAAESAIAAAAVDTAGRLDAKCIVLFTTSGRTARLVSRERPAIPILGFAESERAMRRLSFYWGVAPRCLKTASTMTEHFTDGERALLAAGDVRKGDFVVFLAGLSKVPGATNNLRVHRIGSRLE